MPGEPPPPEIAITSSILRIIHAVSVADFIICSFTTSGSNIFREFISPILPSLALIPDPFLPLFCFARKEMIVSIGSIPAFSAIVNGIDSNASAYCFIASCSLPSKLSAYSFNCPAKYASAEPPPVTIDGVSITS